MPSAYVKISSAGTTFSLFPRILRHQVRLYTLYINSPIIGPFHYYCGFDDFTRIAKHNAIGSHVGLIAFVSFVLHCGEKRGELH